VAVARNAVDTALEQGSRSVDVRRGLLAVRRDVAREPLDTGARVVYASLILGLGREVADLRAAVFHARIAAELSPVTTPVVSTAALVLTRANEGAKAASLVRRMFEYDADAASVLLAELEPNLYPLQIDSALPPLPESWLAWSRQLRARGREGGADEWIRRSHGRWPDHPGVLHQMCALLLRRGDPHALGALFPPSLRLPDTPAAAPALACRAVARAVDGARETARADLQRAHRLAADDASVLSLAGEAHLALGAYDEARRTWNRALYALADSAREPRQRLLVRLARLEQEHGEPAAALRLWRNILETEPQHVEARRRVAELTGTPF
jgi:tetratricopeptide (TPR) repeat protein